MNLWFYELWVPLSVLRTISIWGRMNNILGTQVSSCYAIIAPILVFDVPQFRLTGLWELHSATSPTCIYVLGKQGLLCGELLGSTEEQCPSAWQPAEAMSFLFKQRPCDTSQFLLLPEEPSQCPRAENVWGSHSQPHLWRYNSLASVYNLAQNEQVRHYFSK